MNTVNVQHIGPNTGPLPNNGAHQAQPGNGQFRDILENSLDKSNAPAIKFSSHAINRLQERNIAVTNEDVTRLYDSGGQGLAGDIAAVDKNGNLVADGEYESLLMLSPFNFLIY